MTMATLSAPTSNERDVKSAYRDELKRYYDEREAGGLVSTDRVYKAGRAAGFMDSEIDQALGRVPDLGQCIVEIQEHAKVKRELPALQAELIAEEKRQRYAPPKGEVEEIEQRETLQKKRQAFLNAQGKIGNINSIAPRMWRDLVDSEFDAELRETQSQIDKLQGKAKELREKLKPEAKFVPSINPDAPAGSMMRINLSAEHWQREAEFAADESARANANKKLCEIARLERELADVRSQIDALMAIAQELASRELTVWWVRL